MNYTTGRLKSSARDLLLGKYTFLIAALLLSSLLSYGISALVTYAQPVRSGTLLASLISALCSLISALLTMILSVGTLSLYLNVSRQKECGLNDIFFAFLHHPDRVIILSVLLFLISLACMVPFFVLLLFYLYYAETHFIISLHLCLLAIALVFCVVLTAAILLNYVPVFYLYLDDPEKPSLEVLRESRQLMKGKRCRYLLLQLSFLGMALLAILSLGLGLLWLIPYVNTTNACFYRSLIEKEIE